MSFSGINYIKLAHTIEISGLKVYWNYKISILKKFSFSMEIKFVRISGIFHEIPFASTRQRRLQIATLYFYEIINFLIFIYSVQKYHILINKKYCNNEMQKKKKMVSSLINE
jgi:hypothetical protein